MKLRDYDMECLARARAMIDADSRLHYTIAEIAHEVGMGATRLKAGFKQFYGTGMYAYLLERRMQLACQLLEDKNRTIKAVAKAIGFKYTSNFTAAFKKRFGVTPGKWRIS